MNQTTPTEPTKKTSNKKAIIVIGLMFAIFVVPYTYVLYIYKTGEIPTTSTTEKGIFFNPFLDMKTENYTDIHGKKWTTEKLQNKWAILDFADVDCEEKCLETIFNTQQGISALTQGKGKVDHIILMHPQQKVSEDLLTIISLKKNVHAIQNENLFQVVSQQMKLDASLSKHRAIVDPEANILLFYTPDKSLQEVLRDIKRLLSASEARYHGKNTD